LLILSNMNDKIDNVIKNRTDNRPDNITENIKDNITADILELGAGSGVFGEDLLLELEKLHSLPQHYFILETSADLRERQKKLLMKQIPHLIARIHWLEALPEKKINGIIFANEVMDALPV